jgi:hypothetical protein
VLLSFHLASLFVRVITNSRAPSLHGRYPLHRSRVGGGASGRPGAGHRPPLKPCMQFSRTRLSRRFKLPRCPRRNRWPPGDAAWRTVTATRCIDEWTFWCIRRVDPVHQYPRTRAYGFFTKGTVPTSLILAPLGSFPCPTIFAGCLPRPIRSPVIRSRGFHRASGTTQPSVY